MGSHMSEQDTMPIELTEKKLLAEGNPWALAVFYAKTNRHQIALSYLERRVAKIDKPDSKAFFYMRMGLLMEGNKDYEAAILYYSKVFSFKCEWSLHLYFMNNNTGYCLNQCKRHNEAEAYCRDAINVDPTRHNAYKNLGVSLQGQGHYQEAVECYKKATELCPGDHRALALLEGLIAAQSGDSGGMGMTKRRLGDAERY
jgi:tetratricopeptide (TPR) repeat protein